MAMEIDDLYPDTPFTEEENETLEKLQGNEYTAEYFYLQLKKNKMYTDYLFKCAHPEDETNADIEKIVLDLRAALDYMSLALIDMKYFDFDKAPDSFKFENMEQAINLLTEKFKTYLFPNESNENTALSKCIEDIAKQPKNYLYARDLISNVIINEPIPVSQQFPIDETANKDKRKLKVYSLLTFNFDSAIKDTDLIKKHVVIDEFDRQVINAVVSLIRAGNIIITNQQIHQIITHSSKSRLTDYWKEKIEKSMLKLRAIEITADFSATVKYYPDLAELSETTNLLQFSRVNMKHRNGAAEKAYRMLDTPVLFRVAEAKKQIGTINLEGIINGKTANTVDSALLFNWLLERIEGMKHATNPMSKTILLENIYSRFNKETKREQRNMRERTDKLLLQIKAIKMIKDFDSVYDKNRKLIKYVIYV